MGHTAILKKCRLRSGSSGCCASPEIPEDEATTDTSGRGATCNRQRCGSERDQERKPAPDSESGASQPQNG